jgi:1,4-dihydroxy-2-naphthoyl-CoA hydrolase
VSDGADLESLLQLMPFAVALGIELDAADPAEVRGRLAWAPERCTAGGVMHGGALMALADSLGGICAFLNLPEEATQTTTISSSTAFMRAVRSDDKRRRVAQVTQSQAVLPASS